MRNNKNVPNYIFGKGSLSQINTILSQKRIHNDSRVIFLIDNYFESNPKILSPISFSAKDEIFFVDTTDEPKTTNINLLYNQLKKQSCDNAPYIAVVGIGGGSTLDTTKAISNLLTNEGKAENYQGWDLVKSKGVYKVGIPTLSGTGAESTRTCVMTNPENGLKLGMNSDYSIFDQLILDPDLTYTVPQQQYFFTGLDTYIHCIESLSGTYRNAIGDAFSREALNLCREIFLSDNMKSEKNREKLMVASYLGGCAIAHSFVGLIHPFSAGLSVVLGLHHGEANCIALKALEKFYPEASAEFSKMLEKQKITIPNAICSDLKNEQYENLYLSTIMHEKPLSNALGKNYKQILSREKVIEIFRQI